MASGRPDILLLIGEDIGIHRGCYGDPCGRTPVVDRLAAEGARYTHAFSHAVEPARTSIEMPRARFDAERVNPDGLRA